MQDYRLFMYRKHFSTDIISLMAKIQISLFSERTYLQLRHRRLPSVVSRLDMSLRQLLERERYQSLLI